jgi:hypothetical protein
MLNNNPLTKPGLLSLKQASVWLKQNLFLLSGIVACIGVALRLRQYSANLSLWRDEASLALNIIERSFLGLVQPLDDNQGAPLLFLWIQKGLISIFGPGEYVLRFLPFLCGVISIFVFWFIASKFLSRGATLLAVTLFVFSDPLTEFSSEMKQYSCDVLITILTLVMLFYLVKAPALSYISALGYGLVGATMIWASHPAIFLLASIGIAAAYHAYSKGDYNKAKFLIIMGGMWLASFLASYVILLVSLTNTPYLLSFWRDDFPPSLNNPLSVLEWTVSALLNVFKNAGGLTAFSLGAFVYIVGFISFSHRDRATLISLTLPVLFTLFASFLGKYPFSERLTLFMVPLLFLLMAEGIDQMLRLFSHSQFHLVGPILIVILFFHPLLEAVGYLEKPKVKEEIRPVIEHVHDNWQEGDIIYVYYGAQWPFKYYEKQFGFQEDDYLLGIESREQWINYLPDLNRLQGYKRVWLIFSHVHSGNGVNEEQLMVNWLDRTGAIQKDWFPRAGASSYLYEFGQ